MQTYRAGQFGELTQNLFLESFGHLVYVILRWVERVTVCEQLVDVLKPTLLPLRLGVHVCVFVDLQEED